ncbi:MAG: ImmA/IrrE family metallo-endopeptidase [Sneathiella sp.]
MFKHGFKAQSERRSVEYRKKLGINADDPLSAFNLADHLNIAVAKASEIEGLAVTDLQQLTVHDAQSWSALTISSGLQSVVIYNCSQSPPRVNSVVMHELSHVILGHELSDPSYVEGEVLLAGNYNKSDEAEADWLGGALLLPRPALLRLRSDNLSDLEVTEKYGVSVDMLQWRVRMTGVEKQMYHSRRKSNKLL